MDTRTGDIGKLQDMKIRVPKEFLRAVDSSTLSKKHRKELEQNGHTRLGPRSRCACGSGKRFKSCCMVKPTDNPKKELYTKGKTHPQHIKDVSPQQEKAK